MDRMEDNKATPTKRTGVKNDTGYEDAGNGNEKNLGHDLSLEINQPGSDNATPSIPSEMPARDIR